jgi:hypothetical protein
LYPIRWTNRLTLQAHNLNDQIHIADPDARSNDPEYGEVARRSPTTIALSTFALFAGKRAVVDADGQIVCIRQPWVVKISACAQVL